MNKKFNNKINSWKNRLEKIFNKFKIMNKKLNLYNRNRKNKIKQYQNYNKNYLYKKKLLKNSPVEQTILLIY